MFEHKLRRDTSALSKAEEVDVRDRPGAVVREVSNNPGEELDRRRRVGAVNKLAEGVERGVPLEGLFFKKRDSGMSS